MRAKKYTKETIGQFGVQDRQFPEFHPGDRIEVHQKIKEGEKERVQIFEGNIIGMHNQGISTTFTVRKVGKHGIAVEKIFPYYSPMIKSIKLLGKGDVRRAKLFYIRKKIGKSAQIPEKKLTKIKTKAKPSQKKAEKTQEDSTKIKAKTKETREAKATDKKKQKPKKNNKT